MNEVLAAFAFAGVVTVIVIVLTHVLLRLDWAAVGVAQAASLTEPGR